MKQQGNILLALAVVGVLLVGVIIYYFKFYSLHTPSQSQNLTLPISTPIPESSSNNIQTKEYRSKNLKFAISLSSNFQINEKLGRITISDEKGSIYIERHSTNFDSLSDYLRDLDLQNKPQILEEKQSIINNYETSIRTLKYGSNEIQKVYTIFINGWIYTIYSNSESLFADLDQIAQSFRYTP